MTAGLALGCPETALGLRCGLLAGVETSLPNTRQDGLFFGLKGRGLMFKFSKSRFDLVKTALFGVR